MIHFELKILETTWSYFKLGWYS